MAVSPPPLDPAAAPETVVLRVRNAAGAEIFYQGLLGLRAARSGDRIALTAGGPSPVAPIVLLDAPQAAARPPAAPGLYHFALLLPDREGLGRVLARLLQAGYPLEGGADHDVSEALYLRDPEGNGLELYRDRPRSQWAWHRGQVRMRTERLDWDGVAALGRSGGPAGLPAGTRLGHVHLQVSDLARSETFYRDVVGLDLTARYGREAAFLSAGGYHHHLGLNVWASRGEPAAPDGSAGLVGFTVRVGDPASAAAVAERARGAGHRPEPGVAGEPLTLMDPDGVRVRLLAPEHPGEAQTPGIKRL